MTCPTVLDCLDTRSETADKICYLCIYMHCKNDSCYNQQTLKTRRDQDESYHCLPMCPETKTILRTASLMKRSAFNMVCMFKMNCMDVVATSTLGQQSVIGFAVTFDSLSCLCTNLCRKLPCAVYRWERIWFQGQFIPPHHSRLHVPGWRLHKPQRHWRQEHLRKQVRRRELQAAAHRTWWVGTVLWYS